MRVVILLSILGAAAWYYFLGGRTMDEEMVRSFYTAQNHAILSRDPQTLCAQFASKLHATVESVVAGKNTVQTMDKKQACKSLDDQEKFFEEIGEKAGGMLTIEYNYDIASITLSPDRKSATVEMSSTLKMGEEFMQVFSTSTDHLERSMGRVQLVGAEAKTRMHWMPGAIADPERYFRER